MLLEKAIRQVIAAWPFINAGPRWTPKQFINHVGDLGVAGVELLPYEHWHLLKEKGLTCAATRSHTFVRGMNQVGHHPECLSLLRRAIDRSAAFGFPNVMTFVGLADTRDHENGGVVDQEQGKSNCIAGYKEIVGYAEEKGVTLILEPLNSKVTATMRGHPGYQGDHIDYCMDIILQVNSPALKLLFDVYHIQIMDGDIIRHIKKHKEHIGHVQIAGVPGRGEIDSTQEINYRAVMHALLDIEYDGFVGHEWIPTKDPLDGLEEAVDICAVSQ